MIFFLLALFFSIGILIIFKAFEKYEIRNLQAIVVSYFISGALAVGYSYSNNNITEVIGNNYIIAIILGISFFIGFVFLSLSTQKLGLSITSIAVNISVIIPVIVAAIIYKEKIYHILFDNKLIYIVLFIFIGVFLHISFYGDIMYTSKVDELIYLLSAIPIFIFLSNSQYLQSSKNKLLRFFIFTGTASYSIYLYNYIFYIHIKPFESSILAVVFYTLLVYSTGIVMYYFVEKPFQNKRKKYL